MKLSPKLKKELNIQMNREFDAFYNYAEKMSPLGNASAEECANYCVFLFSEMRKKITMLNLLLMMSLVSEEENLHLTYLIMFLGQVMINGVVVKAVVPKKECG